MPIANDQFYSNLPVNGASLGELLISDSSFSPVPEDWHVIITDIRNSTAAVMNGLHEQVNLIATGSIVAVLNIAFGMDVTIPFFFGGDGATFIVPPSIIDKVMQALVLYKENTLTNYDMYLRTGTVAVKDIYAKGHELHIARSSVSASFAIPIVLGNGLNYADKLIKGPDAIFADHPAQLEELDLSGMQCRWDRIAPPENKEEVVTLLLIADKNIRQSTVFKKVMDSIDNLYGSPQKRQPISVSKLKLRSTFGKFSSAMRERLGKTKMFEIMRSWVLNVIGYFYFLTRKGKRYLRSLVEMSDTLVIDGKINTVISGTIAQRKALQAELDELEQAGELIYGIHISSASIMSCYVRDLEDGHIHFVDGSDGGYTQAAIMLKGKLKQQRDR